MHSCTAEELSKFYPPEETIKTKVDLFIQNGAFQCIDLQEGNTELYGFWESGGNYAGVGVNVVPCGLKYEMYNGTLSLPRDDCNWDKQATIDYVGLS